ncbi:MAG: type VI secretion system protein TssA [candidate division Zixibacteria bacterium]|nr:type VI secretion system protein TssA [candidate division Zixibacteria bacterium]
MAELADYLKLGSLPASPHSPGGEAVDFDDRLDRLKNEIKKLDSVNQNPVNWGTVVELSSELLAKSKTFSLGPYLALGLFETQGYAGLAAGLEICRDLLKNFWDTGFPPPARIKGRSEPFAWLSERGGRAVERLKGNPADLEPVKKAQANLEELSTLLQEKLARSNPGLADLSRALSARASELERKSAPAAAATASVATTTAPTATGTGFPAEITSPKQADEIFPSLQEAGLLVAAAWRTADPTDPRPYQLTRALVWSQVADLPPAEDGLTQIPPPPEHTKEAWENLLSEGSHAELLEAAEAYFSESLFWLDLHRYAVLSMDGLGEAYGRARAAALGELKNLLGRLPGLLELKFSDESPFASDETKKWIQKEVLAGGGGASVPEPAGPSAAATSEKLAETVKKAGELFKKKKTTEAVNLFQEGIKATTEKREQFMWRLALARFCLNAKLSQVAVPHLEQLEREVGRFSLEEWEPRLALEGLMLLYRAYGKATDEGKAFPDTEEKAQKLFARLCQLDPMMALNLGKK